MSEEFTEVGANSFDEFLARHLSGERAQSVDLSRVMSARTRSLLRQAGRLAMDRGQNELDALHILRVLAEDDSVKLAVSQMGVSTERLITATEAWLPAASGAEALTTAEITPSASRALLQAYQLARSSESTYIDPEHLFFALVQGQEAPARQVLARARTCRCGAPFDSEGEADRAMSTTPFG